MKRELVIVKAALKAVADKHHYPKATPVQIYRLAMQHSERVRDKHKRIYRKAYKLAFQEA